MKDGAGETARTKRALGSSLAIRSYSQVFISAPAPAVRGSCRGGRGGVIRYDRGATTRGDHISSSGAAMAGRE